ncbi:hypothetical protein BASA81_017810 [Batrachochytrium salamandrivorans]|nr:hypothetical protein BASA81_017810 [Batrachochytrium salamandrivorans]
MEENSEFIARNLEEVGQARSAANVRTKAQSEAMRKRGGFDENTPDYFFKQLPSADNSVVSSGLRTLMSLC